MGSTVVEGQCPHCQEEGAPVERALHRRMNVCLSRLDEAQRRWYAALESQRIGHGGDRLVAQITGLDEKTIRRGRVELGAGAEMEGHPDARRRRAGAGRPLAEKKIRA